MWDEATRKEFTKLTLLAALLLIVAPVAYLALGYFMTVPSEAPATSELILYMFLLLGMLQPAAAFVVERVQIGNFKKASNTRMSTAQLLFTIGIMKLAMVEAIFIYGLVLRIMGLPIINMLAFYPIGIVWGFMHWPRREKWEKIMQSLEAQ